MRAYEKDPILGDELVFDLQLNEGAGSIVYDLGIGKKVADFACDIGTPTYPAWVIETIGVNKVMTLDFAWVSDAEEPYLDFGVVTAPFDRPSVTNEFTIEAVFYADAAAAQHLIVGGHVEEVSGSGPAFPQLGIETNGYFDFRPCRDSAGAGGAVIGTQVLTGGYHHIVACYSDSDDEAYVEVNGGVTDADSETMLVTTNVRNPLTNNEHVFVGARYNIDGGVLDHQSFWDGHIAFVRMWARRLPQIQRRQLFERCRNRYNL